MNYILYPQSNSDPLFNIKTSIQTSLINNLKTNNILLDSIITLIIITLIGQFINYISFNVNYIYFYITKIYEFLKKLFYYNCNNNKFIKKIIIEEVTSQKELNRLYYAYHWYLTKNINLIYETPLYYCYSTDIELNDKEQLKDNTINQSLHNFKTKEFIYKNHKIKYSFENKLINIYGEKERKRENNIINLETIYNFNDKTDIFIELSQYVMLEYIKSISTFTWEQKIYYLKNNSWVDTFSKNLRNINTLILKKNQKERIFNLLNSFIDSEEWYRERDIPYKIGFLLYGPPGTGKTSLIKTMSNYTKRHIHYLNLSQVNSDTDLLDLLKDIKYDKTIIVIEDIDCISEILQDRDTIKSTMNENVVATQAILDVIKTVINKDETYSDNKLTLSGVLNALDGIFNYHGRILIMTSNKPESLDKALIRPGRIDIVEHLTNCDSYQLMHLYISFYNEINDNIISKLMLIEDFKFSPAQVINIFLKNRLTPENAIDELCQIV